MSKPKLSSGYYTVVFPGIIACLVFLIIFLAGFFVFKKAGSILVALGVLMFFWALLSIKNKKVPIHKPFGSWFVNLNLSNPISLILLIFLILAGLFLIFLGLTI